MKNIFSQEVVIELFARIDSLNKADKPIWGKMNCAQMLAHCNVTYELIFDNKHPKPNFLVKVLLKALVKNGVVNEKPYGRGGQTAPVFLIKDSKDFDLEKSRLKAYINQVFTLGETYFNNKESHSFGVLSVKEWNNMFYKHLDHHLSQFGV